jgi:hypothetical protein
MPSTNDASSRKKRETKVVKQVYNERAYCRWVAHACAYMKSLINIHASDCRAKNKELGSKSFMQRDCSPNQKSKTLQYPNTKPEYPNTKTPNTAIANYDLSTLVSRSGLRQQASFDGLHENLHFEFQHKVHKQLDFQDLAQVLRSRSLARCAEFKFTSGDCMFDSIAHLLQKPSLSLRHACVEEIRSEIERGTDLADCIRVHIESQSYAQAEVHYADAEDYLTHMSKSARDGGEKSWGDALALTYCARAEKIREEIEKRFRQHHFSHSRTC